MKYCGGNKRAERKRQEAKEARALLRAAAREEAGFKSGQKFDEDILETYATVKDHIQKVSVVCVCAWLCEQQERMRERARAKQKRDFIS
jgi:hypothetical protein